MAFGTPFGTPFYTGAGAAAGVPDPYSVAIGGRTYKIDEQVGLTRRSVPTLRPQQDTGATPGEQSLNFEDLWPRLADSWHKGAGQTYLDREGSDRGRFRTSKGVDPWEHWQLSLLPDTEESLSSASTNLDLIPAGSRMYVTDGQVIRYTADLLTWTVLTDTPATTAYSATSDGYALYVAFGPDGVWRANRTDAAAAAWNPLVCTLLGYVKGRLMAANGNVLYNITSPSAPAALYTHPNTDWTWTGFAEGKACLYAAGYSGDKSLIYRTAVKADGTALDIPVVAGDLPDGEIVRAVRGYLGFLLVGTDLGVRFAVPDANGDLTIGSLIPTTSAVRCFEGQDRFVWYGLTDYDATSTGLGRVDFKTFTDELTPAYASDLMATGQGAVLAAATFAGSRVFAVGGLGVFRQSDSLVPSGSLDTGLVTYGLPYRKTAVTVDLRTLPAVGTVEVSMAADGGQFASLGTATIGSGAELPARQTTGETFELRLTLNRSAALTTGPTVTRWTLRAYPSPQVGESWQVPLLLHQSIDVRGQPTRVAVDDEIEFLSSLRSTRVLSTLQLGNTSHAVFLEDFEWKTHHPASDGGWNGTMTVVLKGLP